MENLPITITDVLLDLTDLDQKNAGKAFQAEGTQWRDSEL